MDPQTLFWDLAYVLFAEDHRVTEGTIMGGRCLRVGKEFLALVAHKDAGLVADGTGQPFGPGKQVFKEWVLVPTPDEALWLALLREGVAFVG